MDGEEFPCDLVLLASSNANGKASVLTANLDGETNLKNQTAPLLTRSYRSDHLMTIKAQIECENPNPDLQGFVGRMTVGGHINDGGRSSLPTQKASRGTSHFQVLSRFLAFFPVPFYLEFHLHSIKRVKFFIVGGIEYKQASNNCVGPRECRFAGNKIKKHRLCLWLCSIHRT